MNGLPNARRLVPLLYLAGGLILADQAADLVSTVLSQPVRTGSAEWRFAVVGLLVTRTSVFLLGDLFLLAAAIGLEHRRVVRVLGALHLLAALVLGAGLGLFLLDAVQIRSVVPAEGSGDLLLATARAGALLLLGTAFLVWTGLRTFRGSKPVRPAADANLVVGKTGSGEPRRKRGES